ncbi:hypothetical protein AGMMS50255_3390 [Spirochaetia bacterium]|nr:hypothetical protein AGMMS50255_3390 [Spirochaetia bacterium]
MEEARALLAANIRVRRKKLGLTQEQLAELVNVSYQMIHDIEGCRTWVSDKTLGRLSATLEVDIFELLLPPAGEKGAETYSIRPQLLTRLRKDLKTNIDRQMDEFLESLE